MTCATPPADPFLFFSRSGIWTKTIKGDTGLHHTSMNRVLKSLESKKQIKVVKSVKVCFILSRFSCPKDYSSGVII